MKKFRVRIQETLAKTFFIEAESFWEAEKLAKENYNNKVDGYVLSDRKLSIHADVKVSNYKEK